MEPQLNLVNKYKLWIFLSLMKQLPLVGQDHTQETLHLAGCLWMCDRLIIETSTWQHTTLTKRQTSMPLAGFKSTIPASKWSDPCLKLCSQRLACDAVWIRILLLLFLLHAGTSRKPLMEVLETKSVQFHPGTYFLQYTIVCHTGNSFIWHKCKKKKKSALTKASWIMHTTFTLVNQLY